MIRLLVDSSSDIQNNNSEGIFVVPLSIQINGKSYTDGVDITHDKFYDMLVQSSEFPKTSQPSPQAFVEAYEQLHEDDELICFLLSSGVSGTYQSAALAKEITGNEKIHLVDTLTGAYGTKILVDHALEMIKNGNTVTEILKSVEDLKKRTTILLSVDTLEYLYKGGRLNKTAAIIGGIAKIKPVITVTREGTIDVIAKTIGMNRAMYTMVDQICEIEVDKAFPFYTIYTLGEKNVTKFEEKLSESGITVSEREQLGPVVGSHVGPESFGCIFIAKNTDKIPL